MKDEPIILKEEFNDNGRGPQGSPWERPKPQAPDLPDGRIVHWESEK
jgi:hypothetical protein